MSVIVDIVNSVVDLTDTVITFFTDGIYNTLSEWTAYFIEYSMVAFFKAKLAALEFSWDVAQNIINDLNISSFINQAWQSLDSKISSMLAFFRIPEALNMILSAGVTRFVFKFLGF